MKKIYSLKLLLMLLLLITITVVSTAQNFKLIDLNTLKSSNPSNYSNTFYSTKDSFAVLNGIFYLGQTMGCTEWNYTAAMVLPKALNR